MIDESDAYAIFGECDREGCSEPYSFDMVSIIFDRDEICCSPDCAEVALGTLDDAPEAVTLHDPQFAVDREPLGLDEDVIDFVREVESKEAAEDAIREVADLYPGRFRLARSDPGER